MLRTERIFHFSIMFLLYFTTKITVQKYTDLFYKTENTPTYFIKLKIPDESKA